MSTIAFIGLGNMGSGMAANQAKAGNRVLAFDLSEDAISRAVDNGCEAAGSVAEAVGQADIVLSMLPAGQHVRGLYENDVLPHVKQGALLIDCSTIDVDSARAVNAMAKEAGFRAADAPVSGGTAAADAGTLAFMVGCEEADFADIQAALEPMSKATLHAGASGAGQAAKICNNMLLAITMVGTSETFLMAEKLGLDAQKFFDISSQASGQSWSMTSYCPVPGPVPASPANNDYQPGFAGAMMLKDLRLAMEAARSGGANTPLGEMCAKMFEAFCADGGDIKDFSAIINTLR
ncbi:MAG: 3-hydroxyisobutyrate dehydrogenase [Parvibaculales bacterium]